MRILIVEDELRLATLIRRGLSEEGHAVDIAGNGEEAFCWLRIATYDAIVLDVMLPGMDGFEICRRLRKNRVQVPVLLLTAKDSIEDRVHGLDAGADDYVTKPFALAEIAARLRALGRRPHETVGTTLRAGPIQIDPGTRQVWKDDQEVFLANKEFRILEYLMRNPNLIMTRTMIADHVWNYDFPNVTNVIDVHIRSLRKKLDTPYPDSLIRTVRGVGYRLVVPSA